MVAYSHNELLYSPENEWPTTLYSMKHTFQKHHVERSQKQKSITMSFHSQKVIPVMGGRRTDYTNPCCLKSEWWLLLVDTGGWLNKGRRGLPGPVVSLTHILITWVCSIYLDSPSSKHTLRALPRMHVILPQSFETKVPIPQNQAGSESGGKETTECVVGIFRWGDHSNCIVTFPLLCVFYISQW